MITLYGIKNCDTVKKARKWLDGHGIEYEFHDYKKRGIDEVRLRAWVTDFSQRAVSATMSTLRL